MWYNNSLMNRKGIAFIIILFLELFCTCNNALHSAVKVNKSSYYNVQLLSEFGMTIGAEVHFKVTFNETMPGTENAVAVIVIAGERQNESWYDLLFQDAASGGAYLSVAYTYQLLCMSPSAGRIDLKGGKSGTFTVTIPNNDMYYAYFMLCTDTYEVDVEIETTAVNLRPSGQLNQYLPIELAQLPLLYLTVTFCSLFLAAGWAVECYVMHNAHVNKLHHLIMLAAVVKFIGCAFVTAYYYGESDGKQGSGHEVTRRMAYFFLYLAQALFLAIVLLISLGWCTLRNHLTLREERSVTWVVAVYLLVVGASSGCTTEEAQCDSFLLLEYVFRSLIMLCTVVATNVNVTAIRASIQSTWTASMAVEYLKLRRYIAFRWTFLAFLVLPTLLLLVIKISVLSWEYTWVYVLVQEFMFLLVYVYIAVTFAPFDPDMVTRAFSHASLTPHDPDTVTQAYATVAGRAAGT